MIKVSRFAEAMDNSEPPNVLEECIQMRRMRQNVTKFSEMTKRERAFFEQRVAIHMNRFNDYKVWSKIIQKFI